MLHQGDRLRRGGGAARARRPVPRAQPPGSPVRDSARRCSSQIGSRSSRRPTRRHDRTSSQLHATSSPPLQCTPRVWRDRWGASAAQRCSDTPVTRTDTAAAPRSAARRASTAPWAADRCGSRDRRALSADPPGAAKVELESDQRVRLCEVRAHQKPSSQKTLCWRGTDSNRRFRDALAPPTARRWCDAA